MIHILKNYAGLLLVLVVSFLAIKPLLIAGFFPMHDDTQVARVYEMGKALSDGMFPVRWVADLGYGYGYPIFNFYAPLAYYIGGIFTLLGFDALFATKMMFGMGVFISGVFMYFLAKELFGGKVGIITSLVYVFAPYHAVQLYVRGAVGEFYAYAFIPLVFLSLYKIFYYAEKDHRKTLLWVIIGAIEYTGLVLSHNLTALMITPFFIIGTIIMYFLAFKNKKTFPIYSCLLLLFLGLILPAFYWLPAILEAQFTNIFSQIGGGADFRNHFVCVSQLWDSPWGFGGSTSGCVDGMSFKIGKTHVMAVFLSIILLTFLKKILPQLSNTSEYRRLMAFTVFTILGFFLSVLLMIGAAKPIWESIYVMGFFQYPWRFLVLTSFFSSILIGFCLWVANELLRRQTWGRSGFYVIMIVSVVTLIITNGKLFVPQTIISKNAQDYTSEYAVKWVASKTSDEYMPKNFQKPNSPDTVAKRQVDFDKEAGKVLHSSFRTGHLEVELNMKREEDVQVNIATFPAWEFYINGIRAESWETNIGYVVPISSGKSVLTAAFKQTLIERVANRISLLGVAAIIIGIIYIHKRKFLKSV